MTTTKTLRKPAIEDDQCVELRAVDWKGYSALLRVRGERSAPRIIYLDGMVWIMSPAYFHEHLAERLGHFVMVVVEELDIPCAPSGSTTFRRRMKRGGVEGDKTFYLANEARIRGKKKINLREDPPPDLAIEAVNTHAADAALEVYRRLRTPEVWVCDEDSLNIHVLQPNGRYAPSQNSLAFPFLQATEILAWAIRTQTGSETTWMKDLRRWVREELAQRKQIEVKINSPERAR